MAALPTSPSTHEEREVKFEVPPGFELPDLSEAAPGSTLVRSTVHLSSTYYDTPGHDLLRQRMTLRRRDGDADTGWHLKVPNEPARTEIRLPLTTGRTVPAKLVRLVRGVTLDEPLAPVAAVDTERHVTGVHDSGGGTVVEVADDHVRAQAYGDKVRSTAWHEVEVELGTGSGAGEETLAAFAAVLERAGARVSASGSKLAQALGEQLGGADTPTSGEGAVTAYLAAQVAALAAGDVALRRGLDPVHKTRVAARRTRSVLRVFAPVLPGAQAAGLERELSWYQDLLGEVRDRQVQRQLLAAAVGELPPDLSPGPVAAHLEQTLRSEQAVALEAVTQALDSDRYLQLIRTLRTFAAAPPLPAGVRKKELRRLAGTARRTADQRLAKAIERDARTGTVDPDRLHRARKAAKRARYATELVAPISGPSAATALQRHEAVQDVLGDHQDAVLAAANLARIGVAAGTRRGHNGFGYGVLYGRQLARQQRLRDRIAAFDL